MADSAAAFSWGSYFGGPAGRFAATGVNDPSTAASEVDREANAQPDPSQSQQNMQASGEARRARHHNNTWHTKKCKLHTVMRGVPAAGLEEGAVVAPEVVEARLFQQLVLWVEACSKRALLASLLSGLMVRGCFTRVTVLADGQEAFEDIPAEDAVIPNLGERNLFLQLGRGLPPPGRRSRPSAAVEAVLSAECWRLHKATTTTKVSLGPTATAAAAAATAAAAVAAAAAAVATAAAAAEHRQAASLPVCSATQLQQQSSGDVVLARPPEEPRLQGLWEKDMAKSQLQEYESMLQLLGLGSLQRMTARLIDGIDISQTPEGFSVSFLTVVPFFKVKEVTPWGQKVQLSRRDLRRGKQWSQAEQVAGGVRVHHMWGEPRPGQLTETYTVLSPPDAKASENDEMAVATTLTVGEQKAAVVQVYRRSAKSREQLLRDSRQRNPSLEAVMQRQNESGN
ncbi:hypothetical protein QJQ45_029742 [Haematococcus lacustris]|nr:hypothetical protein QJQ45_029742 [Haematococcus lacustris]